MSDEVTEVTDDLDQGLTEHQVQAAAKREAAEAAAPDTFVDALLEERRGYAVHGRADRVAEVDEQLRLRGVEPPNDAAGDVSRTATRRGRGKGRTADA